MSVDWTAVARAHFWWTQNNTSMDSDHLSAYRVWMISENGIDHGTEHIKIIDEEKYLMFILRYG